jgi:hypothetical protein
MGSDVGQPNACQVALKEWAVTEQALAQGRQILLLRKGGIHEEGKDFRVNHPEFLLYPTFEHQREELLQPEYQSGLQKLLAEPRNEDQINFSHWATVEEVIEVSEQDMVDHLSPHHIWTNAYAQSRLHWKPMLPLSVLLLRVYRMEQPVTVPFLPEYRGCTSWVEVLTPVSLGRLQPVLGDEEFRQQVEQVKGSLGMAATAR